MPPNDPRLTFPEYGECDAKPLLDDLRRLLSPTLMESEFVDAPSAARLLAASLAAYRITIESSRWTTSAVLSRLGADGHRFNLVCAALFDLLCNAEYLHGRVTNRSWIYCDRDRNGPTANAHAYFAFLKQCPRCCLDRGLEPRLSGAQHKPASHHIGEITTTATALILDLLGRSTPARLRIGMITKQSHNVDLLAWRDDLLVLLEVKSSPLVTYPLRVKLSARFTDAAEDGPAEIDQHRLIDVDFAAYDASLYLANRDIDIPLGKPVGANWPYPELERYVATGEGFLDYLEAWGEVFLAYRVPKTERSGHQVPLGYLANGWGDEIDSNKTKAGLGRTDDIKKGTYQLLKFGAYYRRGSPNLAIRGALVANLDPLFLYEDYMAKLTDARWGRSAAFVASTRRPDYLEVRESDLYYLYDAVLAFNRPLVNDGLLRPLADFAGLEQLLFVGGLDSILLDWARS